MLVVELIIPSLNNLFQLKLDRDLLSFPLFVLQLFGLILFIGLLSGIYPAVVLSAFQPSAILKGTTKFSNKGFFKKNFSGLSICGNKLFNYFFIFPYPHK